MKERVYFFTDIDLLDAPGGANHQVESDSFGYEAVAGSEDTFQVSSVHKSNNSSISPYAYAVTDGVAMVRPHSNSTDHVTIVFKPSYQPSKIKGNDLPAVKFYIYRGILRDSIIDPLNGLELVNLPNIDLVNKYHMNHPTIPSSDFVFPKIIGSLGTDTPISESFKKHNYHPLNAGDTLGLFDPTLFSFEIVLEDPYYDPPVKILDKPTSAIRGTIDVAPFPTGGSNADKFENRHKREEIIHYIDPAAFYGSLSFSKVWVKTNATSNSEGTDRDTPNSIYDDIVSKFYNRNHFYIDIRNHHGYSFNYYNFVDSPSLSAEDHYSKDNAYYPRYDDNIELMVKDSTVATVLEATSSYYGAKNWPIRKRKLSTVDPGYSSDRIVIECILKEDRFRFKQTKRNKFNQKIYIANGYPNSKKFGKKSPKDDLRFYDLEYNDPNFGPFEVPIPNETTSGTVPICWYTRLYYLRVEPKLSVQDSGGSKSKIAPPNYFADYLFRPMQLKNPITKDSTDQIVHKLHTADVYVDLKNESGTDVTQGEYFGDVGIAEDSTYVSIYVVPHDSSEDLEKNVSLGFSKVGGKVENSTNSFLDYLNEENLQRNVEAHQLNLVGDPYYYLFEPDGRTSDNRRIKELSKSGMLLMILTKPNWDGIKTFIETKVTNNEFSELLDVYLTIGDRNDMSFDADNDSVYDNSKEYYLSFNLFASGFKKVGGEMIPKSYDLGIKFYGKKDNGKPVLIHTIFQDSNINTSLISIPPSELGCPNIYFKDTDPVRDLGYELFPINESDNYPTAVRNKILTRLGDLSANVYAADLQDFITELYNETVEYVPDPSGAPGNIYRIKQSSKHSYFLLYHHVFSKMITTSSTNEDVHLFISDNDKNDNPNVGLYYGGITDQTVPIKSYSNFKVPQFNGEGKVELHYDAFSGEISAIDPVRSEGYLMEACFCFALWKIGHTMRLAHYYLKGLPELGLASNVQSLFEPLINAYPFFRELHGSIERNEIQPPNKLLKNSGTFTDSEMKTICNKYAAMFDDTKRYDTAVNKPPSTKYPSGQAAIHGFKENFFEYAKEIEPHNAFNITVAGTYIIGFKDEMKNAEDDHYRIISEYLNTFVTCIYRELEGVGFSPRFSNSTFGPKTNHTSSIIGGRTGDFLSGKAFVRRKINTKRLYDNSVIVIHIGSYGVDGTGQYYPAFEATPSTIPDFELTDLNYLLDRTTTMWYDDSVKLVGYFDIDGQDLYILDDRIDEVYFKAYGSSPNELLFNTFSISEVPLFGYAKSLFDLFTDDVFQLTPAQLDLLWDFTDPVEVKKMDDLIGILLSSKPTIEADMFGGFIGQTAVPLGYDSTLSSSYYVNDTAVHIEGGNLNIYKMESGDDPANINTWAIQDFKDSIEYKKGDLISDNKSIFRCTDDFTTGMAPYTFDEVSDWELVVEEFSETKSYEYGNVVIAKDKNDIPALFIAICPTSGPFTEKVWLRASQIESDEQYAFIETTPTPWTAATPEVITPPSPGTLDYVQYARVRYAYARIEWIQAENKFVFHIQGYASPLISRLDVAMNNASNTVGLDKIDDNTIYGQDDTDVAGFIPHGTGPMPSYNQVLTALRCWGILEGMVERILLRTDEIHGTIGVDPEVTPSPQYTTVKTILEDMLDTASVQTTVALTTVSDVVSKSINRADYDLIKL